MLSLLVCLVFDPPKPIGPPDADRSGEPILRRLMDETSKLKNIQIRLATELQQPGQPTDVALPWDIYLKDNRTIRLSISSMWGDQSVFVWDGKAFLHDPLDDSQPIVVKDAVKPAFELDDALSPTGENGSPFWYFLEGSSSLDKLVAKQTPIVVVHEGQFDGVRFSGDAFGNVTALYVPAGKPELRGFRYDNLPYLKKQHHDFPEFVPEPKGDAFFTQMLSYRRLSETRGMFSVQPPAGKPVTDLRKKKSA